MQHEANGKKTRKSYSPKYKKTAVKAALLGGIRPTARDLGIPSATLRNWVNKQVRQKDGAQKNEPIFEMDTHVIRIGDMVFATNPFELFVDYGRRIRNRSKALQTCLVQLSSSSENGFYLPTKRAFDGGHYSGLVKSNWVGPDGGDVLVDKTIKDINSLFKDEDYPRTR
jgi:transposase-like protein